MEMKNLMCKAKRGAELVALNGGIMAMRMVTAYAAKSDPYHVDPDDAGYTANGGVAKLFGQAMNISGSIMRGFQGIVMIIAIAAGVYTLIRMMMASNPQEQATYKKALIGIVVCAFVAAFLPNLIAWISTLGQGLTME